MACGDVAFFLLKSCLSGFTVLLAAWSVSNSSVSTSSRVTILLFRGRQVRYETQPFAVLCIIYSQKYYVRLFPWDATPLPSRHIKPRCGVKIEFSL